MAVVGVGALAGCSGDPAPEPAPPETSPSATESASDDPSADAESPSVEGPPEMPEAAKGTSKKSAEAFVRYAVEVLNYSASSLDAAALRRISLESCDSCRAIAEAVESVGEAGGRLNGGLWKVEELGVVGPVSEELTRVQVLVNADSQVVVEARGERPQTTPPERVLYDFTVAGDGTWSLSEIVEQR